MFSPIEIYFDIPFQAFYQEDILRLNLSYPPTGIICPEGLPYRTDMIFH
jgi:hypothetical protein